MVNQPEKQNYIPPNVKQRFEPTLRRMSQQPTDEMARLFRDTLGGADIFTGRELDNLDILLSQEGTLRSTTELSRHEQQNTRFIQLPFPLSEAEIAEAASAPDLPLIEFHLIAEPMLPSTGQLSPPTRKKKEDKDEDDEIELESEYYGVVGTWFHNSLSQVLPGVYGKVSRVVFEVRKTLAFMQVVDSNLMVHYFTDFVRIAENIAAKFTDEPGKPKSVWYPEVHFTFNKLRGMFEELKEMKLPGHEMKEASSYGRRRELKTISSQLPISETVNAKSEEVNQSEHRKRKLLRYMKVVDFMSKHGFGWWTSTRTDAIRVTPQVESDETQDMLEALNKIKRVQLLNFDKLEKSTYTFKRTKGKYTYMQILGMFLQGIAEGKYLLEIYDLKTQLTGESSAVDLNKAVTDEMQKAVTVHTKIGPKSQKSTQTVSIDRTALEKLYHIVEEAEEGTIPSETTEENEQGFIDEADRLRYEVGDQYLLQLSAMLYGMLAWAEVICVFNNLDILSTKKKRDAFIRNIMKVGIIRVKYPITATKVKKDELTIDKLQVPEEKDIRTDVIEYSTGDDEEFKLMSDQWIYWRILAHAEFLRMERLRRKQESLNTTQPSGDLKKNDH